GPGAGDRGAALCDRADALCRAAAECCRQRARYARLVAIDSCEPEQKVACRVIELCDGLLGEMADAYSRAAATTTGHDDDGWHQANMLLHASREYLRHQSFCDHATRGLESHAPEELDALTMEYELSASALLQLQRAVEAYRRVRPEGNGPGGK
ncbi:MAG TPA: hypothetical protein VFS05_09585, partial [Gemmatimonadaceae bacterium]|nr:hypothetical protein [Gemmatimonadaceae bacterium]